MHKKVVADALVCSQERAGGFEANQQELSRVEQK